MRGHASGLARPMLVIATNVGKIPLRPEPSTPGRGDGESSLVDHRGAITPIPKAPG